MRVPTFGSRASPNIGLSFVVDGMESVGSGRTFNYDKQIVEQILGEYGNGEIAV